MNRQWIIGAVFILAIAAFVAWIANNTYWEEVTIPARLGDEAARNPFYTAQRLTEEVGATSEWRRTVTDMPEPDAVMMLRYWHWDLIGNRRLRLQRWVESGGRLVIDETVAGDVEVLREWSGLARLPVESADDAADADEPAPQDSETDAVVDGCKTLRLVHGQSHTSPSRAGYSVCGHERSGTLTSSSAPAWALEDTRGMQAIRATIGRGSVTWINGSPFGNRSLLDADHAVLFVDATQLNRDDHVVFVSEEERASLLALVWTHGGPAVTLALVFIGLALWRNGTRFGPLAASLDVSRRSLAEQIRGTSQFSLRAGGGRGLHAAMVRALHEAARRQIPNYDRLERRDRLSAVSRLAGIDRDKLADAVDFDDHRRAHEFRNTIALLDSVRSNLMANQRPGRNDPPSKEIPEGTP